MHQTAAKPWEANLDWDTPCGKTLNKLIGMLKRQHKEPISVFLTSGSWFQMIVDPNEATKDLDVIVCRNGPADGLVGFTRTEIEPMLEKEGLLMGHMKDARMPYVDALPHECVLISNESIERMNHFYFQNVRLSVMHPSDWVAMHTPKELQKNNRIQRTVQALQHPTEREYMRAVDDIGGKCVLTRWIGDEKFPVCIFGHDVKRVIPIIRNNIKLHGAEAHFGV